MGYSSLVFLILHILIGRFRPLTLAQPQHCSNSGAFSTNSAYSNNLNAVLSSVPSNITANGGFYNVTAGKDPEKVYSLALCRGDMALKECHDCVNSSTQTIREQCPNSKEAISWGGLGLCLLRYSDRDIFGSMEVEPSFPVSNPSNISAADFDKFNQTLYGLVGRLVTNASSGSDKKFATGFSKFSSSRYVYSMVQCTPDVSKNDCRVCLEGAFDDVMECCGGREGGRFFRPSCFVWFELFKFYESGASEVPLAPPASTKPSPPDNLAPPSITTADKSTKSWIIVIVAVVPSVALVMLVAIACAVFLHRSSKKNVRGDDAIQRLEALQFEFHTLRAATEDFSDANKLGRDGFGAVYKGCLPNGQNIAVKRLFGDSVQGEEQFRNEILLVAQLQHRNLVSLLGYCSEAEEKLLVYEFVGNGSLDHFIFDPVKRTQLSWELRYKIICGIARGLLYLHEDSWLKVIHLDLKMSNILIDEEMNPKISDFGLARLLFVDQSRDNTGRQMGTLVYMAPEYASHGHISVKSDVFSFGVVILEILSGKTNSWLDGSGDVVHLPSHIWKNWRESTVSNVIDPTLEASSRSKIIRCIHIGLLCVQEKVEDRPTMAKVVLMLTSHSFTLPLPSQPAFFMYHSRETALPLGTNSEGTEPGAQQSAGTDSQSFSLLHNEF